MVERIAVQMTSFLVGTGYTIIYYIILASIALTMRKLTRIPDEIFRKLLHCIVLGAFPLYVYGFDKWWHAVLSCVVFAIVVYPVLKFFERFKWYSHMVTERSSGELKSSLIVVFSMYAVVITVCVGVLSEPLLALASVYAWGIGDAAAALIGKKFGRHKIPRSVKSFEGTFAMFAVSFTSVLVILICRGGMAWFGYLLSAVFVAVVSATIELYTSGGYDTITCPFGAMTAMLIMLHLLGGGV